MQQKHTPTFTLIAGGRKPSTTARYSSDPLTSCLIAEAREQLAIAREKRNNSRENLTAEGRNQIATGGALVLLEYLCTHLKETKDMAGTIAVVAHGLAMIIAQLEGINGSVEPGSVGQ